MTAPTNNAAPRGMFARNPRTETRSHRRAAVTTPAEVERLRQLAAACYAGLGAECNLPEPWLDALSAAANGAPFTTDGLLPFKYTPAAPQPEAGAPPVAKYLYALGIGRGVVQVSDEAAVEVGMPLYAAPAPAPQPEQAVAWWIETHGVASVAIKREDLGLLAPRYARPLVFGDGK